MHELLTPGTEVILREVLKENRKTNYDLIGVFYDGQMVSVDSRVPNTLVLEALKNGDIEELSGYNRIKPEYGYDTQDLTSFWPTSTRDFFGSKVVHAGERRCSLVS